MDVLVGDCDIRATVIGYPSEPYLAKVPMSPDVVQEPANRKS